MWDPHKIHGQQRTTAKKCNWMIPRTQMGCVVVQLLNHADSLQPHGLQHARLLCPSLSPGVFSTSCASSWWCYPTISLFVTPFSSCPQSFPESESFLMSQLFSSGGQSVGASASASILPMSIEGWFPLGLMCIFNVKWNLISCQGIFWF